MRGGIGLKVGIKPLGMVALTSYSTGIGKGLEEPCSPYREAYIFGAPFGQVPDAQNWNCPARIVEPTTLFDLSTIEPNHEAVVALLVARNLPGGKSYDVHHKWYRDRDGQLLFDFAHTIPDWTWGYYWYYIYSYIGYVDPAIYGDVEINEDGDYHVDLTIDGFSRRINFTVTGVEVFKPPPEVTVTLQPGEVKTVSFEAIPWEARTYQVSVNGLTGSFVTRYK